MINLNRRGLLYGVLLGIAIQIAIWLGVLIAGCSEPPPDEGTQWPTGQGAV